MNRLTRLILFGFVTVGFFSGCGAETIPRAAVSGNVTLNGQPLKEGDILFTPTSSGPSAGTKIKDGRYDMPLERGPGPGTYRVEINAWREIGRGVEDEAMGTTDETLVSILPPKYNTKSELTAEVESGKENAIDFELTTK